MKLDNLRPPGAHSVDATRGRTSPRNAGSRGITLRSATTTAAPVFDVLIRGNGVSVIDLDDGTAIVDIDNVGGAPVTDPDPGTPEIQVETAQGTGMTIDVPADVVDGTFMFMAIWKDDDPGTTAVTATGWTQIGPGDDLFTYFWRIADGEPLTYSVTYGPGNRRAIGVIVGIPDVDTTNPIAGFAYSTTSDVAISVPTGTYYLLASTEVDSGAVTFTDPTDWDILAQGETGGSYPNTAHEAGVLAGRLWAGSTYSDTITFGSNHGTWDASVLIALKKAGPLDGIEQDIAALDKAKSEVNVTHLLTGTPFPIIAHRGDINPVDGFPEDTLEAYREAVRKGAHGVEFGVSRSSDGVWHCMHDTTVDRTTDGSGAVTSKTAAQIALLNIDGGFGYDAGRHGTSLNVPTLADALDVLVAKDVMIQLAPKEGTIEAYQALAAYIRDLGLSERVAILGPLSGGGAAVQATAPGIATGDDPTDPDPSNIVVPVYSDVVDAAYVQGYEPAGVYPYIDTSDYGIDETTIITNMWTYGCRGFLTNDLPNALLIRNEVVLGITAGTVPDADDIPFTPAGTISSTNVQAAIEEVAADAAAAASGIGPLLIASDHSSPIVFADILQASDGDDFLYASTP